MKDRPCPGRPSALRRIESAASGVPRLLCHGRFRKAPALQGNPVLRRKAGPMGRGRHCRPKPLGPQSRRARRVPLARWVRRARRRLPERPLFHGPRFVRISLNSRIGRPRHRRFPGRRSGGLLLSNHTGVPRACLARPRLRLPHPIPVNNIRANSRTARWLASLRLVPWCRRAQTFSPDSSNRASRRPRPVRPLSGPRRPHLVRRRLRRGNRFIVALSVPVRGCHRVPARRGWVFNPVRVSR